MKVIVMAKVITTLVEAETNSAKFLSSLRTGDKVKKARSMLKNHKIFFANLSEDEWVFAPSRFVGFKNNSVQSHEKDVREENRDGKKVDGIVAELSQNVDNSSPFYAALDSSFLQFCIANQTSPSNHPTPRQYWVSRRDVGHISSDASSSWEGRAKILAATILQTVSASDRSVTRITKTKLTDMNQQELEELIIQKIKDQKRICKLTGIKMKNSGDPNFYPSPDRIDSERGYFRDNIQIVCRFANEWKSDQPNEEFLKLIKVVKGV